MTDGVVGDGMSSEDSGRFESSQDQLAERLAEQVGDVVGALRAAQDIARKWLASEDEVERLEKSDAVDREERLAVLASQRKNLAGQLQSLKEAIDG